MWVLQNINDRFAGSVDCKSANYVKINIFLKPHPLTTVTKSLGGKTVIVYISLPERQCVIDKTFIITSDLNDIYKNI